MSTGYPEQSQLSEQPLEQAQNAMVEDEDPPAKKKRRKVNHACLYCRRSHMTCDDGRPCQRCIKRDIGHLCRDEAKPLPSVKPPMMASAPGGIAPPSLPRQGTMPPGYPYSMPATGPNVMRMNHPPAGSNPAGPSHQNWPSGPHNPQNFGSESFGNEVSVLTDFLDSLDDRTFFAAAPSAPPVSMNADPSSSAAGPNAHPMNGGYAQDVGQHQQPGPHMQGSPEGSYPLGTPVSKTEKFLLTAADQSGGTRDERLAKVIRAKYEAGLLKPYNYVTGYKRLSAWMERNLAPQSRQAIQAPLAQLRPKFRAVAQNLTDLDLVFIEEAFERLLLDYDRVFSAMGIPACLWRRTGEIYKGNREFASLVGVNVNDLTDGKLAIYELMSEESAVNFWEKYGSVAFDQGQKAVLTSCVLRYKPREVNPHHQQQNGQPQEGFVNCCFSFTIRRDAWGIPVAIIGNFISY